jgi:hypothetical protein
MSEVDPQLLKLKKIAEKCLIDAQIEKIESLARLEEAKEVSKCLDGLLKKFESGQMDKKEIVQTLDMLLENL